MRAESHCNPEAVNPYNYDGVGDYGLMQLHGIKELNPARNVEIAYKVKYLHQGWNAWTTYTSGKYLTYLR